MNTFEVLQLPRVIPEELAHSITGGCIGVCLELLDDVILARAKNMALMIYFCYINHVVKLSFISFTFPLDRFFKYA